MKPTIGLLKTVAGTIIAIEQENLRAAGVWIKSHGEAIFNTTYWKITPEEGATVRFTQTPDAFYITTLNAPNETLVLDSPVPYISGDQVTVVGGNMPGSVVPSELLANGSLRLNVSDDLRGADQYAWVFRISYDTGSGASSPGLSTNGSDSGNSSGSESSGLSSGSALDDPTRDTWYLAAVLMAIPLALYQY